MHEFAVWAPHADTVSLRLFTQDADPMTEHRMTSGDDGWWHVTAEAADGDEYVFNLAAGGEQWERIDPRGVEVTSSVGRSIVRSSEQGEMPFTARPVCEWVVYELHPGTFGGDLDGVVGHLDHLVELGVNAIELMPVAEFAGDQSWGYNPALPFAVESSYGGAEAMHRLVGSCHARGIAVVVDVVYNHFGPSDLSLWRFDGWSEGDGGGIYFYNDWRAETPWGATRPDFGRPEVRNYLLDNARMWLGRYRVDGLRLDSTVNIRNARGLGGPDGDLADGWSLMQELTSMVHDEFPNALAFAEDLQRDERITRPVAESGLGFDCQWDAGFVHPVRSALTAERDEDRDLDAVIAALTSPEGFRRLVYTESHDEVANGSTRVPAEIDNDVPGSAHAIRRSALGAVLMMVAPGVPMLFQGQEWADEDWFDDASPLDWSRRDERSGMVLLWGDLIRLRTGQDRRAPGLRSDSIECWQPVPGVLAVRRGRSETDETVIVLNMSAVDHEHLDVGLDGAWTCVFSTDYSGYHSTGRDTRIGGTSGRSALAAYSAQIFSRRPADADV